jgi:hypothetical protein
MHISSASQSLGINFFHRDIPSFLQPLRLLPLPLPIYDSLVSGFDALELGWVDDGCRAASCAAMFSLAGADRSSRRQKVSEEESE